jgi:hypothetical protein
MNAITGVMKGDVSFAAILALPMLIIVANVSSWKRIATAVPKLSISEPPRRIYFMNAKNMASRKDDEYYCAHTHHTLASARVCFVGVGILVRGFTTSKTTFAFHHLFLFVNFVFYFFLLNHLGRSKVRGAMTLLNIDRDFVISIQSVMSWSLCDYSYSLLKKNTCLAAREP